MRETELTKRDGKVRRTLHQRTLVKLMDPREDQEVQALLLDRELEVLKLKLNQDPKLDTEQLVVPREVIKVDCQEVMAAQRKLIKRLRCINSSYVLLRSSTDGAIQNQISWQRSQRTYWSC